MPRTDVDLAMEAIATRLNRIKENWDGVLSLAIQIVSRIESIQADLAESAARAPDLPPEAKAVADSLLSSSAATTLAATLGPLLIAAKTHIEAERVPAPE